MVFPPVIVYKTSIGARMTCVTAGLCAGVKDNSCMEACPVDAIFAADQPPAERQSYAQVNADFRRRGQRQRARSPRPRLPKRLAP